MKVEILSPLAGTECAKSPTKSPIDGILAKNGATPYHICYCVEDINKTSDSLRKAGFIPIGPIAKSEPLNGDVCFLFSSDIGIIELIRHHHENNYEEQENRENQANQENGGQCCE